LSEVINGIKEDSSLEIIKQKWIKWFGSEKKFDKEVTKYLF